MKIHCDVIRDLIPLVNDGAASQESAALVLDHCTSCADCAALLGITPSVTPPDDTKLLRRFKNRLFSGAFAMLLLGIFAGVMLMDDFAMFYNFVLFPVVGAASYFLLKKWCWIAPSITFLGIFLRCFFTTNSDFLTDLFSGMVFGIICTVLVGIGLLIGWLLHWGIGKLRNGRYLWLKLLAIAAAILLIVFCCNLLFSFTGNPITMLMARSAGNAYLAETYPHLSLHITGVNYDFKLTNYYIRVESPENPDIAFTITTRDGSHIAHDSYEESVTKRGAMFARLSNEYQAIINPLIASVPGMEQHTSYYVQYVSAEGPEPNYDLFTLNAPLSRTLIHEMGGELLVRTYTDDVTPEHLAKLMKETHAALKEAGWDAPFYSGSIESRSGDWIYSESYTADELEAISLEELTEAIRLQNE